MSGGMHMDIVTVCALHDMFIHTLTTTLRGGQVGVKNDEHKLLRSLPPK